MQFDVKQKKVYDRRRWYEWHKLYVIEASEVCIFEYRCVKCGKRDSYPVRIRSKGDKLGRTWSMDYYDQEKAERLARQCASDLVLDRLARLHQAVNVDLSYEGVPRIVCESCGKKQPWSGLPRPCRELKRYVIGWPFVFVSLLIGAATVGQYPTVGAVSFGIAALLGAFPLLRTLLRFAWYKRLDASGCEPPVFYKTVEEFAEQNPCASFDGKANQTKKET